MLKCSCATFRLITYYQNSLLGGHLIMSNSEFLSQFKEEFQKLKQQRIEIDQNSRKILLQKMEDSKITIQVLKASGFTIKYFKRFNSNIRK